MSGKMIFLIAHSSISDTVVDYLTNNNFYGVRQIHFVKGTLFKCRTSANSNVFAIV